MDYIANIRALARSDFYQNLYSNAKEISSLNLFDNTTNYSGLQVLFLHWLKVYDVLYSEMHQKEWRYLDQAVLDNDVRCDAFLHWRGIQREAELNKNKNEQKINNMKFKKPGKVSSFDIDFT